MADLRLTIWHEYRHEKTNKTVAALYPQGMHEAIAGYMRQQPGMKVRTATLDEPEHGLTQDVLDQTDVLTWWGHMAHGEVKDEIVDRVQKRVLAGMGLIVLHSGHFSKIFKRMMGTSGSLRWREADERSVVWVVNPNHPIAAGLGPNFVLPKEEMYGEWFDIPEPDELVLVSWFEGGEVFRSGCCWHRGKGKVFYFQPGHETYPSYHQKEVLQVIANAARWAQFTGSTQVQVECTNPKPLFPIRPHA